MKLGLKILAAVGLLLSACISAPAASLLPNGKQQIMDANGAPCVGCSLYFYIPGTTTPKDTWQDADQTILNTNPVVLDSLGTAIIYGSGTYRQILKDASGNTLWDAITADSISLNSSWAGISSGSPNAQTVTLSNFSLEDGQLVYFLAGISNTGATTLNVSSTGAVAVVSDTSTGPQALGGGEITVGNVVGVVYDATAGVFHIVTPTPIQSFNGAIYFNGVITPTILAANTNDWAPTGGFSSANTVRVSSNANINITGLAGGSSGRTIFLRNVGSFTITLSANSSLSTAGNRFIIAAPILLRPNDTVILQYDSLNNGWGQGALNTALPIAGGFKNLLVQNGGTPNNQIIGTADASTLENSAGNSVRRTSLSCTADVTVSGVGGLDTGSVTINTWYSYWFIYNPATNTDNCLLSTASTLSGLTLPTGYTFAARMAWNRTDGSSQFKRVRQVGRVAQYVVTAGTNTAALPQIAANVQGSLTIPTWVAFSISTYVPTTAVTIRGIVGGTSSAGAQAMVAPNNAYGSAASQGNPPVFVRQTNAPFEFVLESTNIYFAGDTNTASFLSCLGWTDNL